MFINIVSVFKNPSTQVSPQMDGNSTVRFQLNKWINTTVLISHWRPGLMSGIQENVSAVPEVSSV